MRPPNRCDGANATRRCCNCKLRHVNGLRVRVDPRRYNGAIFLGLNGIAVKSHGGTDAVGFANAIGVAVDMALHGAIEKIQEDFARLMARPPPDVKAASI